MHKGIFLFFMTDVYVHLIACINKHLYNNSNNAHHSGI